MDSQLKFVNFRKLSTCSEDYSSDTCKCFEHSLLCITVYHSIVQQKNRNDRPGEIIGNDWIF